SSKGSSDFVDNRALSSSLFTRLRDLCNSVSNGSHHTRVSRPQLPFVPQPTIQIKRRDAMKLCSQCEFIYEDDQERCDMDGAELVYEPTLEHVFPSNPLAVKTKLERRGPARVAIPLSKLPRPESSIAPSAVVVPRKRLPLRIAAVALLATFSFVAFYATPRLFQARPQSAKSTTETQ